MPKCKWPLFDIESVLILPFSILVLTVRVGFDFGNVNQCLDALSASSLLLLFPKIVLLPVVWTASLSMTSDIVCLDFSRLNVDRIGVTKQPSSHANRWWNMLNIAYKLHYLMYLCIPLFVMIYSGSRWSCIESGVGSSWIWWCGGLLLDIRICFIVGGGWSE